jgi:hypothetical protein
MKTFKSTLLTSVLLLFCILSFSQDGDKVQSFWIHEDPVKPSKVGQYEEAAKELTENMVKHNVQGTSWLCASTNDFRYLYITPIENMAELDTNTMAPLFEGMGNEAAGAIFDKMNQCYDNHYDYVIHLIPGLSYQPSGINQTPEGQNYRRFFYAYTTPDKAGDLGKAFKAVRDFFEEKGSKAYYRVYRSGFGAKEDFFMVAMAAEGPVEFAQRGVSNDKLLGDDRWEVFNNILSNSSRFEEYEGQMRPDLAYSPKKE